MSSSPVLALRTLQTIIRKATGVEVPLLDLSRTMAAHMQKPELVFSNRAIASYYLRLKNWRAADQIIIRKFHAIREDRRATFADIQELYEAYRQEVLSQGLVPISLMTFRVRAYNIPLPRRRAPQEAGR
jgi:hypothetical protein